MNRTKRMCEEAAIAALYVAVCVTLSPISFGVVQFRIANILCALPLLNKRYVRPILLGGCVCEHDEPIRSGGCSVWSAG